MSVPEKNGDSQDPLPLSPSEKVSFIAGIRAWLETVISDEAQVEPSQLQQKFLSSHSVFIYTERQDRLVHDATRILKDLEEAKRRLLEQFGSSASCFLSKCLDPMIAHLKGLVDGLQVQKVSEGSFEQFLQNAIECVQYYSGLDETKLKLRIVKDAHALVRAAIEKDMEILLNYKEEVLGDTSLEDEKLKELRIILSQLNTLKESSINTNSLHEFFSWKSRIDEERNGLIEMGFLMIDMLKPKL
jgi:hypothetical protein